MPPKSRGGGTLILHHGRSRIQSAKPHDLSDFGGVKMANDSNGSIETILSPSIFVMGCQRSGTTLVARILDSHSRISIYPGTHYYLLFSADRHCYGDLSKSSNLLRL